MNLSNIAELKVESAVVASRNGDNHGSTDRIKHIDAWRFFAVSLVIVHHLVNYAFIDVIDTKMPGISWRVPGLGRLGVLIFFCISGFVICRGLMHEQEKTFSISLAAFYLRRALRIMPPLLIYLVTLAFLTQIGFIRVPWPALVSSASFLCNFSFITDCTWYAGHTWSLAYEEQFYLIFPLLFAAFASNARARAGGISLMIGMLMLAAFSAQISGNIFLASYLTNFIYILSGCACALYWDGLKVLLGRTSWRLWLTVLLAIFLLSGTIALPVHAGEVVRIFVAPPLICLAVLGTPVSNGLIKAIFESQALSYLGKISYTVYLWQQLFDGQYRIFPSWLTPIFIVAVIVFAHFSYQLLERPLMRVASKLSAKIKDGSRAV